MAQVTRWARAASSLARGVPALLRGQELQRNARGVLDALDVRLDTDLDRLSEPGEVGTMIVANHISWIDIVAFLAIEPIAFVAKTEVGDWPLVGPLAKKMGTCFIDRNAMRELPASVGELAKVLRSGRSVVVFPEGTTWCSMPGGDFRRAPFQAALDAGAPIRPLTIEYFQAGQPSTAAAFVGDDTLTASLSRVVAASELTLRIRAHPVLAADGDRRALATETQRVIREAGAPRLAPSHRPGLVDA